MAEEILKVDIKNRTLFLNEDITAKSVQDYILAIHEINRQDDEDESNKKDFKRKPIKLILDTNGGHIYEGMALVNTIESSHTPVHVYSYGIVASMGVIINLAAHKRLTHKRTHFMIHALLAGTWGSIQEVEDDLVQKKKLQQMMEDIIIENSTITQKQLDEIKKLKQDWFFTGQEALDLGVVDELIDSTVKRETKRKEDSQDA